jgi:hypothetical protein
MITYVCCKPEDERFRKYLGPSLEVQRERYGVEVIEVAHPDSIFAAYEEGRQRARHDVIAYVHDDVDLIDPETSAKILQVFEDRPRAGLLGVVGSAGKDHIPWWHNRGARVGQFVDCPGGRPYLRRAKGRSFEATELHGEDLWAAWKALPDAPPLAPTAPAGLLDGLFLAEHRRRLDVPWDFETYGGWHAYDVDRCMQAHAMGLEVLVAPILVVHFDKGFDPSAGDDASENFRRARTKWGIRRSLWKRLERHPWA